MSYRQITRASDLPPLAREVQRAGVVGLDIETTSLAPRDGRIRLMQLNTGKGVYIIDLWRTGGIGPLREVLSNPLATSRRPLIVGHNLKFECKWLLHHHGVSLWPLFDTMRASALVTNGQDDGHKLAEVEQRYLPDIASAGDFDGGQSDWSRSRLTQQQLDYAAADVAHLRQLYTALRAKLAELDLLSVALAEFRAIWPEAAMELEGVPVDAARWQACVDHHAALADAYRRALAKALPSPSGQQTLPGMRQTFNVDSSAQLLDSLARLGIRLPNTRRNTLAMHAGEHPILQELINYRRHSGLHNSFASMLEHRRESTGRVHADYWPLTVTGQYSCTPNLQQIPRDGGWRAAVRAPRGWCLIVRDYAQAEVRLMAQASGDRVLRDTFVRGEDVYRQAASALLGVAPGDVTDVQRQHAKAIVLGFMYGMKPPAVVIRAQSMDGITLSLSQAWGAYHRFFDVYTGVQRWQQRQIDHCKPRARVRAMGGRVRHMRERAHNEYFNTPVQAGRAHALKLALWHVQRRLRRFGGAARLLHMVHDEVMVLCRDDAHLLAQVHREVAAGMIEGMQPLMPDVPVETSGSHGVSWAQAK